MAPSLPQRRDVKIWRIARNFRINYPNPRQFVTEDDFPVRAERMELKLKNADILMYTLRIPEDRVKRIALSEARRHARRGEQLQAELLSKVFHLRA